MLNWSWKWLTLKHVKEGRFSLIFVRITSEYEFIQEKKHLNFESRKCRLMIIFMSNERLS